MTRNPKSINTKFITGKGLCTLKQAVSGALPCIGGYVSQRQYPIEHRKIVNEFKHSRWNYKIPKMEKWQFLHTADLHDN